MAQADQHAPWFDDLLKDGETPAAPEGRRDGLDVAAEQRAELARVLAGVDWPATASRLAAAAVDNDADADLVRRLAELPGRRRFAAVGAVWDELGGPDVEAVAAREVAPSASPPGPGPEPRPRRRHHRFEFAFSPLFVPFAVPLGVTPRTAWVDVDDHRLEIRFGPWVLRTDLDNIAGGEITGPYALPKVLGPPHVSFADRGVTFATNRREGVCIRFREPVPALPFLRHPGATVTVADPGALMAALVA